MITFAQVEEFALSLEATDRHPHFNITSFKVKGKIFLTLNEAAGHVTIRLSQAVQAMYVEYYPGTIYPVASAWGKHGWTHVALETVQDELLPVLITTSYCIAAPKKLAAKYLPPPEDR